MNVLIVLAHHEPKSFCAALAHRAAEGLAAAGHAVVWSDLCAMGFDPVSDRRNFRTVKNPDFLKQQAEEALATAENGFAPELEAEMQKLEACDALVLVYPLWWFGPPAILKGWIDRVFASGRIYGGPKLYEDGLGKAVKRGLVLVTTGGGPAMYNGFGLNPSMDAVLAPVQHGTFWFNGFLPLEPFIAWGPARATPEERAATLAKLGERVKGIFEEEPIRLPRMADFPNFAADTQGRFMAVVTRKKPADAEYMAKVPAEIARIARYRREGFLLNFQMAPVEDPNWKAFITFRAPARGDVERMLGELPLADYLHFEVTELHKG